MPGPRTTEIGKLITDYKAADKDMTEANVEAAFVRDPQFTKSASYIL
jgi:hypothetical protein